MWWTVPGALGKPGAVLGSTKLLVTALGGTGPLSQGLVIEDTCAIPM